ncbi:hypothetical protein [Desulfogranum marinum]|uniref:hypothetical protein n=1 Tax=Desulfogranum marinum TaxID=453220 RepID=UPI0019655988|nr:hypothetical protein [Desulfogranum marinum]MBM9512729.1 hypothetical protein [Desulfogranum marinum]
MVSIRKSTHSKSMNKHLMTSIKPLILTGVLFLSALTLNVYADCSCKIGSNYISTIGMEFTAVSCPPEGLSYTNTTTRVLYLTDPIKCGGSSISKITSYGDADLPPALTISFYQDQGYKILTNPSGTHIIAVHKNFNGQVAGKAVSTISLPTPYVSEDLNQYCTHPTQLADADSDGFPDCLDCSTDDPELSTDCPTCATEHAALINSCAGEKNIAAFDSEACNGYCKSNGPPVCQPDVISR